MTSPALGGVPSPQSIVAKKLVDEASAPYVKVATTPSNAFPSSSRRGTAVTTGGGTITRAIPIVALAREPYRFDVSLSPALLSIQAGLANPLEKASPLKSPNWYIAVLASKFLDMSDG